MRIAVLIVSIAIAQAAGLIGSYFTAGAIDAWFTTLVKPAWNPPNWVFGPVWITLYTLMGVAAYMVWEKRGAPGAKLALVVYGVHIALNALWSILFFGLQNPGAAFAEILVLLVFIIATMLLFWRVYRWAGILLLPYLAWVLFATFLNFAIWQLN